jgi:hypothetical protein
VGRLLYFLFFGGVGWDWIYLVRRPLSGLLYQHRMTDYECGTVSGIRIGRGNRSTRRKPAPVPLCPPQIPHDLTLARTGAAAVGSRWLTAWAMARPNCVISVQDFCDTVMKLCKRKGIPWIVARLLAYHEELCFMVLINLEHFSSDSQQKIIDIHRFYICL